MAKKGNLVGASHKFLLEHSLLGLAKLLRFAGADVRVYRASPFGRVLAILRSEQRLLIQQGNKRVLGCNDVYRLLGVGRWLWLEQMVCDGLLGQLLVGERCPECNGLLHLTDKEKVAGRVPEGVLAGYEDFRVCYGCGRVYWAGAQYYSLLKRMKKIWVSFG